MDVRKIRRKYKKGDVVMIDDIEDINGLLTDEDVKPVEGTGGEELVFLKTVTIFITIKSK